MNQNNRSLVNETNNLKLLGFMFLAFILVMFLKLLNESIFTHLTGRYLLLRYLVYYAVIIAIFYWYTGEKKTRVILGMVGFGFILSSLLSSLFYSPALIEIHWIHAVIFFILLLPFIGYFVVVLDGETIHGFGGYENSCLFLFLFFGGGCILILISAFLTHYIVPLLNWIFWLVSGSIILIESYSVKRLGRFKTFSLTLVLLLAASIICILLIKPFWIGGIFFLIIFILLMITGLNEHSKRSNLYY